MTVQNWFRKEVLESPPYVVAHVDDAIKLNQNESPWDIPLELKVAISEKLIRTDFNRYPLAEPLELKKKIAKRNDVLTDQVAISSGSNVMIQALVNATCTRGKGKVLIPDPTFVVYEMQADLFGAKTVRVPLTDNFAFPTEAFLAAMKKESPSLIFIPNPNAPTANLFAKDSLYKIVKAADCLTVIDEAYFEFSGETVQDWLTDFPHLIVLRTLSKAFALAGVRLGYALGDADVIYHLEKVLLPFSVPTTTCLIAGEVLNHPDYLESYAQKILAERKRVFAEMQKMPGLQAYPSDANFILFRCANSSQMARELKMRGVLVRDVSNAGVLKNCLRVAIGDSAENDAFLKAASDVLPGLSD